MTTVGGFDLLMTTVTPSTEVSCTSAGSGGSFDFQGQGSGPAAKRGKLAVMTAKNAVNAPRRTGRFMHVSLFGLKQGCLSEHSSSTWGCAAALSFRLPGLRAARAAGLA